MSGNYTDIADVWLARNKTDFPWESKNGKSGEFGKINFQTVQGNPKSGEGNLQFCLMESGTNNRVAQNFTFTIYDLDSRNDDIVKNNNGKKKISIKEKLLFQTSQAKFYQLDDNTEVGVWCEDDESPPCIGRTVFNSSTAGLPGGDNNPDDPDGLTPLQKSRSIAFNFENRDCWEFTFDHYCPVEQSDFTCGVRNCGTSCRGTYTGGNFLFSGKSTLFVNNGTCTTPLPTISPSVAPSVEPSESPTIVPTRPLRTPSSLPTNRAAILRLHLRFHPLNVPRTSTSSPPLVAPLWT